MNQRVVGEVVWSRQNNMTTMSAMDTTDGQSNLLLSYRWRRLEPMRPMNSRFASESRFAHHFFFFEDGVVRLTSATTAASSNDCVKGVTV